MAYSEETYRIIQHKFHGSFYTIQPPYVNFIVDFEFQLSEDFFPKTVKFTFDPDRVVDELDLNKQKITIIKMQKGMVGILTPIRPVPAIHEEFVVEVIDVNNEGNEVIAAIQRPKLVPISAWRHSLLIEAPWASSIHSQSLAPFTLVITLANIKIESERLDLDDNTAIIKLTEPDKVEISQHLSSYQTGGGKALSFHKPEFALCFLNPPDQATLKTPQTVLQALRLFKPGDVDIAHHLFFAKQGGTSGHSLNDKPNYRYPVEPYLLKQDEFENFKKWLFYFANVEHTLEAEAVLGRALYRFEKTYLPGHPSERVTDAVIGLEALVSLGNNSEISHRFAHRIGFLLAKHPEGRLKWAMLGKEFYDHRSAVAHTGINNPIEEVVANKAQNTLRLVIRKICNFESPLRELFCNSGKNERAARDRFFENLIAFGSIEQGFENWLKQQEAEKERLANSKPKSKSSEILNENEEDW